MHLFYRRMDILNRLYILNHFPLELLNQPTLLEIPKVSELKVKALDYPPYCNLKDMRLIIYSLPPNKVRQVFKYLLLMLIAKDRSFTVDAKLLLKIEQQLSRYDLERVLSLKHIAKQLSLSRDILIKYDLNEIIAHLMYGYFLPLANHLPDGLHQRFLPLTMHKLLIDAVVNMHFDYDISEAIKHNLPNTYKIVLSWH